MEYRWMVLMISVASGSLTAQAPIRVPPKEKQVADAIEAAPKELKATATVMGYDAKGLFVTLRAGTGDMVCLADDPKDPNYQVACYHKALDPFMARGRQLRIEGKKRPEIESIRLAEVKSGALKMPDRPAALYTLNAEAKDLDPVTGKPKHAQPLAVVYIPFATPETTGITATPARGVPWIMDPGKPWAHIMIVP